jgi:hypothetical protein
MLSGDADPLEFHQINLRAYDGSHSLVSDLLTSALDAYAQLVKLPLLSPKMDEIGDLMLARMAYNSAAPGLKASVITSGASRILQLSSTSAISIPVTGLAVSGAEFYGGEFISTIKLAAGGSASFTLSSATSAQLPAVADTYTDASAPTTARGSATSIKVNASTPRTAFLRFDLSTLTGKTLKSAALELTTTADASAGSGNTQSVHLVGSTTWSESLLTATNTVPASSISTVTIGSLSKSRPSTKYVIPLTLSTVQAHVGQLMSIDIDSNGADELIVSSREGAVAPALVVTY